MTTGNLDQEILLALNSFAGGSAWLEELTNNALFRGFPVFFCLVILWFSGESGQRRGQMLAALLGVCFATILSVWSQFHIPVHTRPMLDPALHLTTVLPQWKWDRTSSFPSDTATLFFGLATVVLLMNRLMGLLCFIWVAVIVAIPRVVFGFHYPSDIVGSLILGPTCVYLFSRFAYPRMLFERALMLFDGRMHILHALLFVFLAEASNLFLSLEQLGKDILRFLHS